MKDREHKYTIPMYSVRGKDIADQTKVHFMFYVSPKVWLWEIMIQYERGDTTQPSPIKHSL